jgi:hypothetical protein
MLVLCVPTSPEWSLLAFDLEKPDIAGSCWRVEYSSLLAGVDIMSFAFCPLNERRLYLLDTWGIMRILEISRRMTSSTALISTVRTDGLPPVLSAVLNEAPQRRLYTATMSQDSQ